jgi:hypothetical protein
LDLGDVPKHTFTFGQDIGCKWSLLIQARPTDYQHSIENAGALGDQPRPLVRGIALQPKKLKATEYSLAGVKVALADPCTPSCQNIMLRQMKSMWRWEPEFMIADVPRAEGINLTLKKDKKGEESPGEGKDPKDGPDDGKPKGAVS